MDGSPIITPAVDVDAAAKPLNRREQARAKTQAKALAAARDLFSLTAYDDVTMRGLARAIDMSTGALFANWADKAALWREAMECEPPVDTLPRRRRLQRQQRVLELIAGRDIWTEQTALDFTALAAWALTGSATGREADVVTMYFEGYYEAAIDEGAYAGQPALDLARQEILELEEPQS